MNRLKTLCQNLVDAMTPSGLSIPVTAVKFYRQGDAVPSEVSANEASGISLTSCQAFRQASLGDAVFLNRDNIGCIAAAISLGLVDQNDDRPLSGSRVYTDIMRDQSGLGGGFRPPTPRDFTEGIVYACKSAGRPDFCLFGENDSGRFKDTATAKRAVAEMTAIQPAVMQGVFFYSPDFDDIDLAPDVVVLTVRPVELARIVQAYQFDTGKRVQASMGAVRAVNSDLIARPYVTGEINVSTFCVGARLIAKFDAVHMGIGMPFSVFEGIVAAMEASQNGYPFAQYPGAVE